MEDFRIYLPEDTVTNNLRQLSERLDFLSEQELAHLRELAWQAVSDSDPEELLSSLPDRRPPDFPVAGEVLSESRGMLTALHGMHRTRRALLFSREIRRLLSEEQSIPLSALLRENEPSEEAGPHRIAYQRSIYTDSAYLRLSPLLEDPRASYTHSFHAACEEVYNHLCDACILPLENSTDGQLSSFSRLIDRYDLKIAATCEISGGGAERSTRFALLRRSILPLFPVSGGSLRFECAVPQGETPGCTEILTAASLCGLSLLRVDTLPSREEPGALSSRLAFSVDGGDLESFLLYLSMELPHYTPVGLYPHLPNQQSRS